LVLLFKIIYLKNKNQITMKSKILTIIGLCFLKTLSAQDSLKVTTENNPFTPPQYSTAYDDVFMNKKDAKWLVKVDALDFMLHLYNNDALDLRSSGKLPHLRVEFERKIKENMSVNFGLHTNRGFAVSTFKAPLSLSVEPRYYFNMANRIAAGKSGNNLNGTYLGLRTDVLLLRASNPRAVEPVNYGFMLNYGIQKRVFNNWYMGYRVGVGVANTTYSTSRWVTLGADPTVNFDNHQWESRLESKFTIGLAFGGNKKEQANTCDLFRCFEEENSLWKFDIQNAIPSITQRKLFYTDSSFKMGLSAAYEHKIGQSSWSLNTELRGSYSTNSRQELPLKNVQVGLSLEPRYYYNQKKRIANGQSANNLSGNYFTVETSLNYFYQHYDYSPNAVVEGGKVRFAPKWGMQRRLFKNGFFDLSVTPLEYFLFLKDSPFYKKGGHLNMYKVYGDIPMPKIDFKIGFAF
jgi:hypothetical protein